MARSVEPVAPDLVLLVIAVGKTIDVGMLRHGLMEGRIEHRDLRYGGKDLGDGLDSHDIGGIVKRREGNALSEGRHHLRIQLYGGRELFARVDDPVSDGAQLAQRGQHPMPLVHKGIKDKLDAHLVIRDGGHLDHRFHTRLGVLDLRPVDTDTLHQPLREDALRIHVEKLILQGRAAAVDD